LGFSDGFVSGYVVSCAKSALKIGALSRSLLPGLALAVLLFGLTRWSALAGAVFAGDDGGPGLAVRGADFARAIKTQPWAFSTQRRSPACYILLSKMSIRQKLDEVGCSAASWAWADADLWIAFGISALAVLSLTALQRPLLILLFEPKCSRRAWACRCAS